MTAAVSSARPACSERALVFACAGETLLGVLATPTGARRAGPGVVIVVGGPQYRAGSHRQFTRLARALAAAGTPCLRFDVRGMGDSGGAQRSFESLDEDIAAALDAAQQAEPACEGWVLWGLCDGASAALMYLHARRDPRVRGLCLANPWVRSVESLARAHVQHYYGRRLMEPAFWRKLLSGGVGLGALRGLWSALRTTAASNTGVAAKSPPRGFVQRMLDGLRGFDGPVQLLLSGNDLTACEFVDLCGRDPGWQQAIARDNVSQADLPRADHTFSDTDDEVRLHAFVQGWLVDHFAFAPAAGLPCPPAIPEAG